MTGRPTDSGLPLHSFDSRPSFVRIIVYDDRGREQGIISSFGRETPLLSHKSLSAPAIMYPPTSPLCFTVPRRRASRKGMNWKTVTFRSRAARFVLQTIGERPKQPFTLLERPANRVCKKFGNLAMFAGNIILGEVRWTWTVMMLYV